MWLWNITTISNYGTTILRFKILRWYFDRLYVFVECQWDFQLEKSYVVWWSTPSYNTNDILNNSHWKRNLFWEYTYPPYAVCLNCFETLRIWEFILVSKALLTPALISIWWPFCSQCNTQWAAVKIQFGAMMLPPQNFVYEPKMYNGRGKFQSNFFFFESFTIFGFILKRYNKRVFRWFSCTTTNYTTFIVFSLICW